MASGSVRSGRYMHGSCNLISFSKSFSANARTTTTAEEVDYPVVPDGCIAVFAGTNRNNSSTLIVLFNANASGSAGLIDIRNVSSATTQTCNFRYSYLRSEMVDDQRE